MSLLQAILLSLIALIITPGYFFYFDVTPKVVALLFGTAALLLLTRGPSVPKLFTWLVLFNLASLAVSTVFSTRPGLSIIGTSWREFGLAPQSAALLFAWTLAANPQSARAVLRGVAITGLAAGGYGIAQYFGWDPLLPAAAYHIGEGIWTIVRPPGTMGYVSYFATWLAMAAFLGIALAEREKEPAWRCAAWSSAGVCAFAMLLTGTRATMLGLTAGLVVWFWLRNGKPRSMDIRRRFPLRRVAPIVTLALVASAAFYFSPAGWNLRSRARWFAEDPYGGGRLLLWRDTLRMAAARPLIGFGPETFTAEFAGYESPELARQRPDFEYESPHNMFLDAFAAQGASGLIALAALCGGAAFVGFRTRSAGLMAAVTAGIVSQQFAVMTPPTALLFYATCALLIPAENGGNRAPIAPIRIALAIALAVCAIPLALSDRLLAKTQASLKSSDSASAAAFYARYRRYRMPAEFVADLWYSRASLELAQRAQNPVVRLEALSQAQAAAAQATRTADDPANAWYNLAAFDALTGNSAVTEGALRRAIAVRPNWFKPHWTLARLLLLEGRTGEGEREAALAASLDGGKDAEVMRTLRDVRDQLQR